MGDLTNYYVDPASGDDGTGDGSSGTPWATVQHALDNITRDSTNGDQINVKAGTDDTLTAALDFTTYGGPSSDAPLIFRGYTSTAEDGGIGGISGGGSVSITDETTLDNVDFVDMHLHDCGSNPIIKLDDNCRLINCELDNTTGLGASLGTYSAVLNCHFHNIGGIGLALNHGVVKWNYFANGTNSFTTTVNFSSGALPIVAHNIFSLSGSTNGVAFSGFPPLCTHNSFLSSGTGTAISKSADDMIMDVANNLFEGFSTWIDTSFATANTRGIITGNAGYNASGTEYDLGDEEYLYSEDNESLASSPFAKNGSDTYANRATYFEPNDVGNVWTPYGGMASAKGAIQPAGANACVVLSRRPAMHFHL